MAAAIPIIAVIASVASTVYSVVSSEQAGTKAEHAEDRAAARQAEAEALNAQMARDQAEQAKKAAGQRESDYRERAAAALGLERSGRAGQGVTMEGTPLLTFYTNMRKYEEDALRIREGGAVEEKGYLQQARMHGMAGQGALEAGEYTSSAIQSTTKANTGKTLLTGATDIFSLGKQAGWWGNAPVTKV